MGARRRAGPALIAAALIGLGLALYRPRLVPELRIGSRGATPSSSRMEHAGAAGLTAASRYDPSSAGLTGAASSPRPDAAFENPALRDAPAELPFTPGAHAAAKRGWEVHPTRSSREWRDAPSAAEATAGHFPSSDRTPKGQGEAAPSPTQAQDSRFPGGGRARSRGSPLASGPAPAGGDIGTDSSRAVAAGANIRRDEATWSKRRTRAFPLFRPPRGPTARPKPASARRRVRPLLLSQRLGRGALRPPPSTLAAPDLSRLSGRKPGLLPDGSPAPTLPFELERLEAYAPPGPGAACRRREPHWDAGALWHDGAARGVAAQTRWLWLWKQDARWWALADATRPPLLRHQNLWWSKQRGVWFAVHDGELWSWRRFSDWDAEGLLRLTDGVELVYSADFAKVAVITPGEGAVLYDAATGAALGEWQEDELPPRRPRAPDGLRLPRGI